MNLTKEILFDNVCKICNAYNVPSVSEVIYTGWYNRFSRQLCKIATAVILVGD